MKTFYGKILLTIISFSTITSGLFGNRVQVTLVKTFTTDEITATQGLRFLDGKRLTSKEFNDSIENLLKGRNLAKDTLLFGANRLDNINLLEYAFRWENDLLFQLLIKESVFDINMTMTIDERTFPVSLLQFAMTIIPPPLRMQKTRFLLNLGANPNLRFDIHGTVPLQTIASLVPFNDPNLQNLKPIMDLMIEKGATITFDLLRYWLRRSRGQEIFEYLKSAAEKQGLRVRVVPGRIPEASELSQILK